MKFLKIHINNYIYILYMSGNMNEVRKIKKLNQYFYMTPEGDILKYKKYCIINNCKKIASFNHSGQKEFLYCNDHKLDEMVNVKKGYLYCDIHKIPYLKICQQCDIIFCDLCKIKTNKNHFFSKKHINTFENNITIKTKTSIKKKFIDIIFDFNLIDKDLFYGDIYFKDRVKKLILKNCKKDKNYKINIYKYNQKVKGDLTNYWIEKYKIDHIDEIDNIDKMKLKNFKNLKTTDFDDIIGFDREGYDGDDPENISIISNGDIEYDSSNLSIIQNTRLVVKLSEYNPFSGGSLKEIKQIPEIFFKKRNILIIKNLNDNKCLLWCFIRRFLNDIKKNPSRINKKDIEISKEIINEHNYEFEDITLDEINEIENLLECNIHIFGCNKKMDSKKIIRKSKSCFERDLDLLLIDEINHYILIKNLNSFISNNSHVVKTCRNCLNVFYSESKYEFHIQYCLNRKPQKLVPSYKKYMRFENLKNCIKRNWLIQSDFECVINPDTKEHEFVAGAYYLQCENEIYSKNIQTFYNLEGYIRSLYNELKYVEEIEEKYLNNPIDYDDFNQEEFDNTLKCKYCDCEFNHPYNDRIIILNEIVDKQKLKNILDNNDFNEEVNNLARNYYESLDDLGRKRVVYKQKQTHKDRYYPVGSALTYLKKDIRNSIMPKNIRDLDMVNSHPVILYNLCQKNNIPCKILKNYIENRNIILESFGDNKKVVKELFLTILNGGFKEKYSDDNRINDYLNLFEKEIIEIQKIFYKKDKRYLEKGYNYLGKNLSRIILDIENQILQVMINYFVLKRVNILTLEFDGLKIYSNDNSRHFSINDLEKIILEKTGINMKLAFKTINDIFPEMGIRVSTDDIKTENIIENKLKIVHHNHAFEKNNIISYICRECNLQIKNDKVIPIFFFNGMKYDNSIILKSLCDIYKDEITLKCIGNTCESFKMIHFKFKNMKYSFKLLDICNFIKGSLSKLSDKLLDENKIVTKKHFPNNFDLLKTKISFPYEYLTKENMFDKELPSIDKFYSSLKLKNISEEDYEKTLEIFKKLNCKNIKDFLEIYLKLDVSLQSDIFNTFRKIIYDKFEIDCTKYITSCSLSLDLMLKYTKVNIELFKDITTFDYVNDSIIGGICIASTNIADNNNEKSVISSCDIVSLYPSIMVQKLPISSYKFVSKFDRYRYGQTKEHGALLLCEIYSNTKVLENKILNEFPALLSKTSVDYNHLSEFQKLNLKQNYKSSEKIIAHHGYNKNCYISFEMYEMMRLLGYKIKIKKILEYRHENFMKPYIDFLFEKKSYYKSIKDVGMSNTFKILANSLFGVMMTRVEKFRDFKIVSTEEQVDKQVKKPNYLCRNIVNENLSIVELEKTSVIYSYPILIGSIILQNSKVRMFEYLYKIYPKVFGNDYQVLYMDTDSIYSKLYMSHDKYLEILDKNKNYFGDDLGLIKPEILDNPIQEAIFLSSKCYSYICKSDIPGNENKMKNNISHTKGIVDCYSKQYIDHNIFKETLLNNNKPNKVTFNIISVKNQKIKTKEINKNNIEFLNDKRYIEDINSNIPHTLFIE